MMASPDSRPLPELLDAAGRAIQPTYPGWQTLPQPLRTILPRSQHRWPWWLAPGPVALAAGILLFLFLGHSSSLVSPPSLRAEEGPVRVERHEVELTVLSVSATEGETLYMPILEKLGNRVLPGPISLNTARQAMGWEQRIHLQVLNSYPQPARTLTGQALVKDHRLVLNLKEGDNTVRFTEVAATIDPTSVRLAADPPDIVIKEQNFEYDLANADGLLQRYLDRPITCIARESREETTGYLVSYDAQAIVLASGHPSSNPKNVRKTQTLDRASLQAIRLGEVPRDLLVKPTLVWKLHAPRAGRLDATLSYLCGFIKWQADYVVVDTPGEGLQPDLLDVTGWVSLDNTSGATYNQAGLKLIAGDVNRQRDPWALPIIEPHSEVLFSTSARDFRDRDKDDKEKKKEFVEKSFFEYHLYTLTAPSTVRDQQIKQLNLLHRTGVTAARRYVYDPQADGRRLAIELAAKNELDNHLGLPLPKGRVTFEQRDADGETAVTGNTDIDHTPLKEELTLRYGFAFDLAGDFRQVNYQQPGPNHTIASYEMVVRNHMNSVVQVRAVAHLGPHGKITQASLPYEAHDSETAYFNFPLQANAEQVITYTVDTQW